MNNRTLELEYKYRVAADDEVQLVPFTVAVLLTVYPPICMYHHDTPISPLPKSHLCQECTAALGRSFQLIADEWANLQDGLARSGRATSSERVGGTNDPALGPLPINVDVSDAMGKARAAVWSTVGQLMQDRPDLRLPADHNTDVLADWIARRHTGYLASHPSASHLHSVFTDIAFAAEAVRDQAYECRPVEVEMNVACHHGGCGGGVVAVQTPDGRKVVRCSEDITHRVAADQWFYTHANSRPGRASSTLKKKYMKARTA